MIETELVLIWVGTMHHKVDCIAPALGYKLGRKYKIRSMFCDGSNIAEVKQQCINLRKDKSRKFKFVAIDVGFTYDKCFMVRVDGGIRPSSAVKKQKIHVGDIAYVVNINDVYKHIKNKATLELFTENYTDRKVIKKRNKIISKLYKRLDFLLANQ